MYTKYGAVLPRSHNREQQDFYVEHDGHSSLSRERSSQFLVKSEEIHNVNDAEQCLQKENRQSGNDYGRAVRSCVQRQL